MPQNEKLGRPHATKGKTLAKHPGLIELDLNQSYPWCQSLVGLVKWLSWHTEAIVGKSKVGVYRQVIEETLEQLSLSSEQKKELLKHFQKVAEKEAKENVPSERYEDFGTKKFIHPFEATRRIRYFAEDFINKEFDVFCSLLPSQMLSEYLNEHFSLDPSGRWNVFGNSNDLEFTTNVLFMQVDTIAYNPDTSTLVGFELKVDAELGQQQIFKYCMFAAALESRGLIAPNSKLKLLVIGASKKHPETPKQALNTAKQQLADKKYPKRGLSLEEAEKIHPRAAKIIEESELVYTDWQELAEWFEKQLPKINYNGAEESCYRLLDGFLCSLEQKYSRKQERVLYKPTFSDAKDLGKRAPVASSSFAEKLAPSKSSEGGIPWSTINLILGFGILSFIYAILRVLSV